MSPLAYLAAFVAGFVLLHPTTIEAALDGLGWLFDKLMQAVGR